MKFKRGSLHQLSATESRYILVCLTIIPSLSSISFAFHYYNTFASNAIALLVIPAFIVVGRILHKVERTLELRLAFACKFLTWLLSCQINKRCFVIGVTRMVTQLPHFPIGHSLDSPGVMVPDEANLGYLVYLASMSVLGVLLISTKTLMHFQ
jgi:hypothetical protein